MLLNASDSPVSSGREVWVDGNRVRNLNNVKSACFGKHAVYVHALGTNLKR
jgi:hypothetical protein